MTEPPYYIRIVGNMQQLLDKEPNEVKQTASVAMLILSFAMHYADNDTSIARQAVDELHGIVRDLLLRMEEDEKRPRH